MREFINAADFDILNERAEKFEVQGRDVVVHSNPPRGAIARLLQNAQFGMVRGFCIGDSIFFWDASDAIHHQIWRQVTDDFHNVRLFMMGFDLETVVADARREYEQPNYFTFLEDADMGFFYVAKGAEEELLSNPAFARMFNCQEFDPTETFDTINESEARSYANALKRMIEQSGCPAENLELVTLGGDRVEIRRLFVSPADRRKGKGGEIMAALCRGADQLGVTLEVFPRADLDGGLEQVDLEMWYERLGFGYIANRDTGSELEYDDYMVRSPR